MVERFEHNQSVLFLAFHNGHAAGVMQLYPSFSSASLARIFVLNDLFVNPDARRHGVASALIRSAADYGRRVRAVRLVLATAVTNSTAQAVYETLGGKRDVLFCHYQLSLSEPS
ncbi:MAG TPA: GNAT family N-acetyltransferase [Bryobacteraceae bacterium]|nr:GNAT family N-acetyltransferase [Bryobacteraceae bacterium]